MLGLGPKKLLMLLVAFAVVGVTGVLMMGLVLSFVFPPTNPNMATAMDPPQRWGAGYYVLAPRGKRFTEVTATFIVPSRFSWGAGGSVAVWPGISLFGRTRGSKLMQAGTFQRTGTVFPWWADQGRAYTPFHSFSQALGARPGDVVYARTQRVAAGGWLFVMRDKTSGTDRSFAKGP